MADSPQVKALKEKYKDRINPTQEQKDKGVIPLTAVEVAAIDQGIDPDNVHHTAGDTSRNNVTQQQELASVEEKGDGAANLSVSEDRKDVANPVKDAAIAESERAAKVADEEKKAAAKETKKESNANK